MEQRSLPSHRQQLEVSRKICQQLLDDYNTVTAELKHAAPEERDRLQQEAERLSEHHKSMAESVALGQQLYEGPFKTAEDWAWMLTQGALADKVVGLPPDVPEKLVQLGIHNPVAVGLLDMEELCSVFGPDGDVAQQALDTCLSFHWSVTQWDLLTTGVQPITPSSIEGSAFQQDTLIELQIQYRRLDIERDMLGLKATVDRSRRVYSRLSSAICKGLVGKFAVDYGYAKVVPKINSMLQVDALQKGDHPYQLQYHRIGSTTASTVEAISRITAPEQAHAASRHAHEQASGIRHIPHWSLTRTGGHDTRTAAVGLDVQIEQLMIIRKDGKVASPYAKELEVKAGGIHADPPDALQLLQQAGSPAEAKDPTQEKMRIHVESSVKQLARFCRDANACWGFFGTFNYTWAMKLEGNIAYISDPVRCTDTEPSTLLLLYYVCCQGIEEAEGRNEPPSGYPDGQDGASGAGCSSQDGPVAAATDAARAAAAAAGDNTASYAGPASRTRSRARAGADNIASDTGPARRSFARMGEKAYKRQQHVEPEAADLAELSDQQPRLQITKIRDLASAALAAGTVDLDLVQGFLGSGWTGYVFDYRMLDGKSAALKVAQPGSEQAAALSVEASALLALRSQWNEGVAEMLASGTGKDGHGCVLAVERIPDCRHLEPSSDRDVLQQLQRLLAAVHKCGVAHLDLSCENILVQKLPNGSKKAWLIDWGFAVVQATRQQKWQDSYQLQELFDT